MFKETSNPASFQVLLNITGESIILSDEDKNLGRFSFIITVFVVIKVVSQTQILLSEAVETTDSTTQVVRLSGKTSVMILNSPF